MLVGAPCPRLAASTSRSITSRRAVEAEGISIEGVTAELVEEGVAAFSTSFEELLGVIDGQRQALARS